MPYGHEEGAHPLGQWVAEQRRACRAGQMSGLRARRMERLGMVWSPYEVAWEEGLTAARG
ncbi:helicase associated domain-containing protein [Streptomyces sp. NPDC020472]|uniref:helicase associated domain-containing protein n=1 Tax=Streptomyces sp. NPDC020472 TaxID=3365075 RepID=UPI0037934952